MFKTIERPADCEIRSVIWFLTARNVSAADIHRQISEVYGPNAMSCIKVRKWARAFKDGRENVHDEPRSGRPSMITEDLCCDGNCGACEKPCGRTLGCGHHKCASVCHRGPCYPCPLTVQVKCRCGATAITVPCGRNKKTRPPRCFKPCRIPPDCHHTQRDPHRCHFGSCPPCRQICDLPHDNCPHSCPKTCHSAVLVNVLDNFKPAGPWEKVAPQLELRALPCGDCWDSVSVSCLGAHEVTNVPCYRARPYPCGRPCGRRLPCGNHTCSATCHEVVKAANNEDAGTNCEPCSSKCTFSRPEGCTHPCQEACHPPPCKPCQLMLRFRCHCNLNQLFIRCGEWTDASEEEREKMLTCGNQCPKNAYTEQPTTKNWRGQRPILNGDHHGRNKMAVKGNGSWLLGNIVTMCINAHNAEEAYQQFLTTVTRALDNAFPKKRRRPKAQS
ncbi:NF-X1-type zinc finger protein nfxl1 [Homalodisca vitripennis]|nr:NF-X1-type zinc finger protein nfxl1 [Homalodisca vitripennis]